MVVTLPTMKCTNPNCGAETIRRVPRPVKCPRCGSKYKYDEDVEQKTEVKPA